MDLTVERVFEALTFWPDTGQFFWRKATALIAPWVVAAVIAGFGHSAAAGWTALFAFLQNWVLLETTRWN